MKTLLQQFPKVTNTAITVENIYLQQKCVYHTSCIAILPENQGQTSYTVFQKDTKLITLAP